MAKVSVNGITVGSGQRAYGTIPVTLMSNGAPLELPLHILNGRRAGPKLLLVSATHGDSYLSIEIVRQILQAVDLKLLCGTIIAIPCANPLAFEWQSRHTPHDMFNMNRVFPGNPRGWLTEQMAAAISPLCAEADCLIDYHGGRFGMGINYVLLKLDSGAVSAETRRLGLAYGLNYLYAGPPAGPAAAYAGSLTDYMEILGKPSVIAEVGAGMPVAFDIVGDSVRGAFNIMQTLGMYPGRPILPPKQYLLHKRPLLRAQKGGLFYPECDWSMLNKCVKKGSLIGRIRNPLSLEVVEELYAPCDETVFLSMRGMLSQVHPGSYAYILGDRSSATVIENSEKRL
jgi:predicted deacylase